MTGSSEQGFTFVIPKLLADKVSFSKVYVNYGVMEKETSFGIDLSIPEIALNKTLRSRELDLLPGKVEATLNSWVKKYQRSLDAKEQERKAASIEEMNAKAESAIKNLSGILAQTIDVHDAVDWDRIKITGGLSLDAGSLFEDRVSPDFMNFDESGRPVGFEETPVPGQPTLEDTRSQFGILSQTFRGKAIEQQFQERTGAWTKEELEIGRKNEQRETLFKDALSVFENKAAAFEEEKRLNNQALENIRERYQSAEPKAIEEYCDLVLNNSIYPDYFPKNWVLEYQNNSRKIVANYDLPAPDQLPSVKSYKLVAESDEVIEEKLSSTVSQELHNSVVYQLCIRTIHELFEADVVDAIEGVIFNGVVSFINPATGQNQSKCILSVSAEKNSFMEFELGRVDPQATFEHLRGVTDGQPADLVRVVPILDLKRTDKRFL